MGILHLSSAPVIHTRSIKAIQNSISPVFCCVIFMLLADICLMSWMWPHPLMIVLRWYMICFYLFS